MIPKNEHPRPQWQRNEWINLNGEWEFEFDFGRSALDRERQLAEHLDSKIIVPFCPESELSGVNYKDFMPAVCYKREFEVTKDNLDGRILLHFGAVDYKAQVYELNIPVKTNLGFAEEKSLLNVSEKNIIIETVKFAEDGSGDMIIRMYESGNTYTSCNISLGFDARETYLTNMLEENISSVEIQNRKINLEIKPFEIVTIRVKL